MSDSQINFLVLQSKLKSKREIFVFLTQDCKAHLPPMKSTNAYFLS